MVEPVSFVPRVVVATINIGRGSVAEDVTGIAIDELRHAQVTFIRSVTVNREKRFIEQLVMNVANSNEADAIVLIGGVGLGPRDFTCEAIESLVDRRIEGFGEAFRLMLREELGAGVQALLQRATAGVYNKCVVFALPRQLEPVRRAMRKLVLPTLAEALRIAAQ